MAKKITQNVNKDKLFNDLPKVQPFMSKWKSKSANYLACDLGWIVPIYWDEVLPKEKRTITTGMISHTTTPVAPIFNSMYTEVRSFFVPARLCADLLNGYKDRKSPWVKVFGEDNSSAESSVIVPLSNQKLPDLSTRFINEVASYVNNSPVPNNIFDFLDISHPSMSTANISKQNFLQLAAYELIYQRHYRNENYESSTESSLYKWLFNAYNKTGDASSYTSDHHYFEIANREKDYFTGMKPFTQKSSEPIHVGLGDEAKLKASTETYTIGGNARLGAVYTEDSVVHVDDGNVYLDNNDGGIYISSTAATGDHAINRTNLKVDLKNAQGISIEELRLLIKTQELLEKDAMYGSRYAESLNAHFGTCPLDLTLQDPQELFKVTITSNMQAVFQTSSTSGESSILGTIGANSTTQADPFIILPETKFEEHGILMICAVHKLQNVYDARYFKPKFNFKKSRFDFYTPELNDLGFQPVAGGTEMVAASGVAGYNEAFAEYRYKFNKSHGSLNGTFSYWAPAISNEYSTAAAMYKEDASILDKALSAYSTSVPQFYDAWGFEEINEKPMTLHSIPGFDGVI